MFRIGIIGSDNSHADAFSKLVNIPDPKTGEFLFPDCKITGIFGLEKKRTEEVAANGKIDFIAEKPEDLMDKVDAVMVVFRHGDLHAQYALPFIKAGIPTWIDKPFTIKNEDALSLINAAREHNTLLTGGSTCKYAYDVLMLKNAVEAGSRIGKIKSAVLNFPATLENEYGGIYFYGAHLAEMTMAAFGYNAKSVVANENNGSVIATVNYENYQVVMNFIPDSKEYYAIVYGEKGTMFREIDISFVYRLGFEKFVEMLRTKKLPMPLEHLYAPVALLNAVAESYKSKKEVALKLI
ncbi:MAG: Gfo/Idh/MocA family oxidoreductase [Firmicutes bacterium]|nr:Gfo/Idh/MocA family oxidoreductase [Bacillota bacterium]